MTTAKKLFESRMELLMAANDRDTADKDSVYIDYIFNLEQEKAELIEFVRDIAHNDISRNDITLDWVQKTAWELLNKHTDKPDAL